MLDFLDSLTCRVLAPKVFLCKVTTMAPEQSCYAYSNKVDLQMIDKLRYCYHCIISCKLNRYFLFHIENERQTLYFWIIEKGEVIINLSFSRIFFTVAAQKRSIFLKLKVFMLYIQSSFLDIAVICFVNCFMMHIRLYTHFRVR